MSDRRLRKFSNSTFEETRLDEVPSSIPPFAPDPVCPTPWNGGEHARSGEGWPGEGRRDSGRGNEEETVGELDNSFKQTTTQFQHQGDQSGAALPRLWKGRDGAILVLH